MPNSQSVLWQVDDRGVATVTLNRPEVNNAYDAALIQGLHDAMDALGAGVRAVLLRGAGPQIGLATQRLLAGWRAYGVGVTLSAGAAVHMSGRGPAETFRAADRAMYDAKHQGRDRAVLERLVAASA